MNKGHLSFSKLSLNGGWPHKGEKDTYASSEPPYCKIHIALEEVYNPVALVSLGWNVRLTSIIAGKNPFTQG